MRTATTPMALGLTAALVSLGLWTAEARQPAGESTIEGVWVLNAALSDEMPKPSRDGDSSRGDRDDARRGAGPGVGGGFFGRGPVGNRGGRPDPEKMAANREGMQSAMEDLTTAPRRMTIESATAAKC